MANARYWSDNRDGRSHGDESKQVSFFAAAIFVLRWFCVFGFSSAFDLNSGILWTKGHVSWAFWRNDDENCNTAATGWRS
jgi:hypothetical protein